MGELRKDAYLMTKEFEEARTLLASEGNLTEEEIDAAVSFYEDELYYASCIINGIHRHCVRCSKSIENFCSTYEVLARIGAKGLAFSIRKNPTQDGAKQMVLDFFVEPSFSNAFMLPEYLKNIVDEIHLSVRRDGFSSDVKAISEEVCRDYDEDTYLRFRTYLHQKAEGYRMEWEYE